MRIDNQISLRSLPVSLKLNNSSKFNPPIKNNGYIINPHKFANEIKEDSINIDEIKKLLLMMLRGNSNFIDTLVKTGNSKYVNTIA